MGLVNDCSTITLDDYKNSFQIIEGRQADTWVGFEEKELQIRSLHQKVLVPYTYAKPPAFVRFIYWLLDCLRGEAHTSRTTKQLLSCLKMSIRTIKDASIDQQLRALEISETLLTKLEKSPEQKMRKLRELEEIRAQILADQDLANTLKEYTLGPKSKEIAYSIDWSKDDPILFDPTYLNDLSHYGKKHPDLKDNPHIASSTKKKFISFITDLMAGRRIKDHYGHELSKENRDQLRKMTLAIMNHVNAQRQDSGFQEFFATVVDTMCIALDNCSNRINTQFESIFLDLTYPKGGSLGLSASLALQTFRLHLFQKGIHLIASQDPYYLEHEAATFSYYCARMTELGQMKTVFGLPPSISRFDHRYEGCAMKGKEEALKVYFERELTPVAIFKRLSEAIQNPFDPSIPSELFTKWAQSKYGTEELAALLDETGKYRPECFIRLFTELQLFEHKATNNQKLKKQQSRAA